jgi:transcriptional regulator
MYIPAAFRHDEAETLLAFMQANSFITLVSQLEGSLIASHIPVVVQHHEGVVMIIGHLAKANPHCTALEAGESLAIFTGPHAYVSPTLYEKHENVPTWNYIAVHATGTTRTRHAAEDRAGMDQTMRDLIATYEASYQAQWDSLPERYRAGMLNGIVGFELTVTKLEGKYKLSQNRSEIDRQTVAGTLASSDDQVIQATGEAMFATLHP